MYCLLFRCCNCKCILPLFLCSVLAEVMFCCVWAVCVHVFVTVVILFIWGVCSTSDTSISSVPTRVRLFSTVLNCSHRVYIPVFRMQHEVSIVSYYFYFNFVSYYFYFSFLLLLHTSLVCVRPKTCLFGSAVSYGVNVLIPSICYQGCLTVMLPAFVSMGSITCMHLGYCVLSKTEIANH